MHVHESYECRRDQQLVRDGVEKNAQRGDLHPPPGQVTIRPIRRRSHQQDQHSPDLEMHGDAPKRDVGATGQQNHDEDGNEKNSQQSQ